MREASSPLYMIYAKLPTGLGSSVPHLHQRLRWPGHFRPTGLIMLITLYFHLLPLSSGAINHSLSATATLFLSKFWRTGDKHGLIRLVIYSFHCQTSCLDWRLGWSFHPPGRQLRTCFSGIVFVSICGRKPHRPSQSFYEISTHALLLSDQSSFPLSFHTGRLNMLFMITYGPVWNSIAQMFSNQFLPNMQPGRIYGYFMAIIYVYVRVFSPFLFIRAGYLVLLAVLGPSILYLSFHKSNNLVATDRKSVV